MRDDVEAGVVDLVADLLHYSARRGFDVARIVARAVDHYAFETREGARP